VPPKKRKIKRNGEPERGFENGSSTIQKTEGKTASVAREDGRRLTRDR
jgi:hypothetical protein